jgi:hypothetical protein
MGILVLAALVGGGGLVARNRGKKEAAPAAVTPGGADLASPAGAVSAQSPPTPTTPTPTPRQQPEDEILWEDLGERDRAKFEQAIRDFGIES